MATLEEKEIRKLKFSAQNALNEIRLSSGHSDVAEAKLEGQIIAYKRVLKE